MPQINLLEMRKVQEFKPYHMWDNNLSTNCIAYAIGLQIDDPKREFFREILLGSPIQKLEQIFSVLGFEHRRISSPSEIKEDEYGIVLYHYFYKEKKRAFGMEWEEDAEETHLVRIELDGTWTHKFGWDYDASITTPEEIHDTILEEDKLEVQPTAYFAIRKSQ